MMYNCSGVIPNSEYQMQVDAEFSDDEFGLTVNIIMTPDEDEDEIPMERTGVLTSFRVDIDNSWSKKS